MYKQTNVLEKEAALGLRYEQAKRAVIDHIRALNLQPGDRLPTEMELRSRHGWSRDTITRALNELVGEGVLRRVQGSGTYVADPKPVRTPNRIVVGSRPFRAHDDYCNALFAGIREEAAEQQIEVRYYMDDVVPAQSVVSDLNADGVLSMSWQIDDWPRVYKLHQAGVPIVGFALRSRIAPAPVVCTDNYGGVEKAVTTLLDLGHKRIAFYSINMQCDDSYERLLGYQNTMAAAGLPVDPLYVHLSMVHWETALIDAWWNSLDPAPTALLVDGISAPAVVSMLMASGVRIPEELSVVVMGEVAAVSHFNPPLASVRQPAYELGRRGLQKLIRIMRKEDEGAPEVLATEFDPAGSIAAPKCDATDYFKDNS